MGVDLGPPPLKQEDYMYVSVRACQRCEQNHESVLFQRLSNASDSWEWWALCPTTLQPILMKMIESK